MDISKGFGESLGIRDNESQLYSSLTSPIESGMCPTIWVNVVPVNEINLYNTQGGKRVLIPYLSISIYEQQRPRPACAYVQSNHISLDKAFFFLTQNYWYFSCFSTDIIVGTH